MENNVKEQDTKKSGNKKKNNKSGTSKRVNKSPVKVVYISNPLKIKTRASQFRSLVQQLTGRDSDFPHYDPTKLSGDEDLTVKINGGDLDDDDDQVVVNNNSNNDDTKYYYSRDSNNTNYTSSSSNNSVTNNQHGFEDEDVFMPQIIEGFGGILPSTSAWYEYIDSPN